MVIHLDKNAIVIFGLKNHCSWIPLFIITIGRKKILKTIVCNYKLKLSFFLIIIWFKLYTIETTIVFQLKSLIKNVFNYIFLNYIYFCWMKQNYWSNIFECILKKYGISKKILKFWHFSGAFHFKYDCLRIWKLLLRQKIWNVWTRTHYDVKIRFHKNATAKRCKRVEPEATITSFVQIALLSFSPHIIITLFLHYTLNHYFKISYNMYYLSKIIKHFPSHFFY